MNPDGVCISLEEYKELLKSKMIAECLMKAIEDCSSLDFSQLLMLRTMFRGDEE